MFSEFKRAMQVHMQRMLSASATMYLTDVNRDELWDEYLNTFPDSLRQEYNCNACKSFVRHFGGIIFISENYRKRTIWDFECEEPYQRVVKVLHTLVSQAKVVDQFFTTEVNMGIDKNRQIISTGIPIGNAAEEFKVISWDHMYFRLPNNMIVSARGATSNETLAGSARTTKEVFKRGLEEITLGALNTVLELISQNSLYRGEESKGAIVAFLTSKLKYIGLTEEQQDLFAWREANTTGTALARIRNTAMGTLLVDLSEGKELDVAVSAFERIMAPTNYKRPQALITQKMVEEAEKTIEKLGYSQSLGRRFADVEDLRVNNLLFVDKDTAMEGSLLGKLKEDALVNPKTLSKVEEVSLDKFITDILPTLTSLEVLFENGQEPNLVSLIAPKVPNSPSMFKWDNGFSWSYRNAVTDSIKEKVKAAGGSVQGDLRCSLAWFNFDDLDLHMVEPNGNKIWFRDKRSAYTDGTLDVDMNAGSGTTREAVENIVYPRKSKMREGNYTLQVNQYAKRENVDVGFEVEIEAQGEVFTLSYDKPVQGTISVANIQYKKDGAFTVVPSKELQGGSKIASKRVWGIDTQKFQKVSMVMLSPNMWDKQFGNGHIFFIIEGAHNDEQVRGFFNEFLKSELEVHKRVFEALGAKMKVEPSDKQVSGLGFSHTNHGAFIVRVNGAFKRVLRVKY